jgi:alkylhydroperoxidase family enzyme
MRRTSEGHQRRPTPSDAHGHARIRPGGRREIGVVNAGIARALGAATGGPPPRIFTTLARHRRLFRPWLRFAARLMPFGVLPRGDGELVILRVAHLCDSAYERAQHVRLAREAGLSYDEIERVAEGPAAPGWSARQAALLRATDELHERRDLSDVRWSELSAHLSEVERIELPMLVGHYEMLAMTLNSLRVEPDQPGDGRIARLVRRHRRHE